MKKFEIDPTSPHSPRTQARLALLAMPVGDEMEFPRTLPTVGKGSASMMEIIDKIQNRKGGWINHTSPGRNVVKRVSDRQAWV